MWPRNFLLILVLIYSTHSYKILVVSPIPGKSHNILGNGLVKHLTQAGHEITYITSYPLQKPGVKNIDVSYNLEIFDPDKFLNLKNVLEKKVNANNLLDMFHSIFTVSNATVQNQNVQNLLKDESQQFDLILAEWMFSEIYAGFSAVFNCPYIWFSTVEPHWIVLRLIDEFPHPAYTNDANSENVHPFTFLQRTRELIQQIGGTLLEEFYVSKLDDECYQNYFAPIMRQRGKPVPSMDSLRFNASLMLGNSHVSMGSPTRLPESYKHIGGYHIDANIQPLPEDLKNIMDNAKHGVIYFSLGTNVKSKTLPDTIKQNLLKMFGELKQTVIWKFEEDLPGVPKNVHIVQWAPQQGILAHKNCAIFITHGGLLSITEVIHFGVPIIGIPVFTDQFGNVERAVKKGFAKRVDLSYSVAQELKEAINEVLTNPRYRIKVKELSLIYHDRPVHPGKELVHWVEHVIKTKGAPHLRSPALMMPWYQKYYIDLLFLIVILAYGLKFAIISGINVICNKNKDKKLKIK